MVCHGAGTFERHSYSFLQVSVLLLIIVLTSHLSTYKVDPTAVMISLLCNLAMKIFHEEIFRGQDGFSASVTGNKIE